MGDSARVKVDYTTIQCYDPVNKCEISRIRSQDSDLHPKFSENCQGTPVQCCDMELVNKSYLPEDVGDREVPLHIRKTDNNIYEICPPEVYKECLKEEQVGLCAAQRCNDLGYLEPDNYYQVCKALGKGDRKGNIPDCSDRTCRQVVNLKKRDARGMRTIEDLREEVASQMRSQCRTYEDDAFRDKGYTLGDLFNFFPDDESFFIRGALIIAGIIVLIMFFNWYLGPPRGEKLGGGEAYDYLQGSGLLDEYMGSFDI